MAEEDELELRMSANFELMAAMEHARAHPEERVARSKHGTEEY